MVVVRRSWRRTVVWDLHPPLSLISVVLMATGFLAVGACLLAVVGLSALVYAIRRRMVERKEFCHWAKASQLTYQIPVSPPFRSLRAHRQAVRSIYLLRLIDAPKIASATLLPLAFVEAVLYYLQDRPEEGGAGIGAKLGPRTPSPLVDAE